MPSTLCTRSVPSAYKIFLFVRISIVYICCFHFSSIILPCLTYFRALNKKKIYRKTTTKGSLGYFSTFSRPPLFVYSTRDANGARVNLFFILELYLIYLYSILDHPSGLYVYKLNVSVSTIMYCRV